MKTALVYDRVNKWGGAERVLLALHELFPDAPLYTSVYSSKGAPWARAFTKVIPSFLQHMPWAPSHHEWFPYLMPSVFESFDFSRFDQVISVTSEAAKGIITQPETRHISYCLTPTRYIWSGYKEYFKSPIKKAISKPLVSYLRKWDKMAAQRPDQLIAISTTVQKRIKRFYKRKSEIIFPPVELDKFKSSLKRRKDFYLVVSRLVPYKRVDLAISAFNKLKLPLVIVGVGSQKAVLQKMAESNVSFLGTVTDSQLQDLYQTCKALVFPQNEDFGLVAAEAHAAGAPVIAYKKGGAKDIILPGITGLFFDKQAVDELILAIDNFSQLTFDSNIIATYAKKFSKERFKEEFLKATQ